MVKTTRLSHTDHSRTRSLQFVRDNRKVTMHKKAILSLIVAVPSVRSRDAVTADKVPTFSSYLARRLTSHSRNHGKNNSYIIIMRRLLVDAQLPFSRKVNSKILIQLCLVTSWSRLLRRKLAKGEGALCIALFSLIRNS